MIGYCAPGFAQRSGYRKLVAEVFEIRRYAEIAAADELDDGLEFVLLFSGDANLSILQLTLHFETLRFDGLDNLFGFVAFESLLNFQFLSRVAQR